LTPGKRLLTYSLQSANFQPTRMLWN